MKVGGTSVERWDLEVATAGVTMVRAVGGLLGLSILGGVFASTLAAFGADRALRLAFQLAAIPTAIQFAASWLLIDPEHSPDQAT